MKLEPQDDAPPLQIPPSTTIPPPVMMPQTHFNYGNYSLTSIPPPLAPVAEMPPGPPPLSSGPLSSSRPPSSAGIPPPLPLGMLPDAAQQVAAVMHTSIPLEPVASMPHSPDFVPPVSASSAPPTAMQSGFMSSNSVWPDNHATVPRQHHHSLSAGGLLNSEFAVTNAVPVAGPSTLTYSTPMYSPTRSTHMVQTPLNAASATMGRASRSHSLHMTGQ